MDFKIKVNVDTGEAIEKLERIKSLYEEIIELQNEKVVVNVTVKNEADLDMVKTSISEENAKNNDFTLFLVVALLLDLSMSLNCFLLCTFRTVTVRKGQKGVLIYEYRRS